MVNSVVVDNVSLLPKTAARVSANLLVLETYGQKTQSFTATRAVLVENLARVQPWRGNLLVLGTGPNALTADVYIGQDTYGWPVESFEPPTFVQAWKFNAVIRNAGPPYVPAIDRRAKQSIQFFEPEVFPQPWKASQVLVNTFVPYSFKTDVRRGKQALSFTDPEIFFGPQFHNAITISGTASLVMPNVVGLPVTLAISILTADGFTSIATGNALSSTVAPGVVAQQLPAAGTGVSVNTPITLLAPGLMPNLVGLLLQEALLVLQQTGFLVPAAIGYFGTYPVTVVWIASSTNHGIVMAQSLPAGLPAGINQPITLTVNDYPEGVVFP